MSDAFVHELAVVEPGAQLSAGVKIWHFCHVRAGAKLGQGVQLGQGVHVAQDVVIGAGSKIQNGVSLFTGVHLEEDVFIGPHAVFTNVLTPRAHISRRQEYARTHIARGVSIGANATIVCGVSLGAYSMVGAGSVVTRDVRAFSLVVGNPARHLGWVCQCGERLVFEASLAACSRCQTRYAQREDAVQEVSA